MTLLEILPALDIKNGSAVWLTQDEAEVKNNFVNPSQIILEFISAGANWIHLVDLDAAYGHGNNFEMLRDIVQSSAVDIQLSGGIVDDKTLDQALSIGCTRINLSTAALANISWVSSVIKQFGNRIVVALDMNDGRLTPRGGKELELNPFDVIKQLDDFGCSRYVITDVTRDGTLTGPNFELLRQIVSFTKTPIIASGGVASLTDIDELNKLTDFGVEAVIIGKALYRNKFSLLQALQQVQKI